MSEEQSVLHLTEIILRDNAQIVELTAENEKLTADRAGDQQLLFHYECEIQKLQDYVNELQCKLASAVCIGEPIIKILAEKGFWASKDGYSLVAASGLFKHDPYEKIKQLQEQLNVLNKDKREDVPVR